MKGSENGGVKGAKSPPVKHLKLLPSSCQQNLHQISELVTSEAQR